MLPGIPGNKEGIIFLVRVVKEKNRGVDAQVGRIEEGGNAGFGVHPTNNDQVGVC